MTHRPHITEIHTYTASDFKTYLQVHLSDNTHYQGYLRQNGRYTFPDPDNGLPGRIEAHLVSPTGEEFEIDHEIMLGPWRG